MRLHLPIQAQRCVLMDLLLTSCRLLTRFRLAHPCYRNSIPCNRPLLLLLLLLATPLKPLSICLQCFRLDPLAHNPEQHSPCSVVRCSPCVLPHVTPGRSPAGQEP
jgi:hypothetical protein